MAIELKDMSIGETTSLRIPVTVRIGIAYLEDVDIQKMRLTPEEIAEATIGLAQRALAEGAIHGGNNVVYVRGFEGQPKLWQP